MRVFLSWSGERSGQVAAALRGWLTDVLHVLEPWSSSEDIDKGTRWSLRLAQELQDTDVGIVCLTPENVTAPWIVFEAGALAKSLESSRVCTYLVDLRPTDVDGPLAAFHATEATKPDTLRLLRMLNGRLGDRIRPEDQLTRAFEKWWPELETALASIVASRPTLRQIRGERDLLEEILQTLRLQERATADRSTILQRLPTALQWSLLEDTIASERLVEVLAARLDLAMPTTLDASHPLSALELDGRWQSQWSAHDRQMNGVAKLIAHKNLLTGIDDEGRYGNFLLVARQRDDGLLIGAWVNWSARHDSGPWVGRIAAADRIDGQWKGGRWDLHRIREGSQGLQENLRAAP
jgi:hypothetical protein